MTADTEAQQVEAQKKTIGVRKILLEAPLAKLRLEIGEVKFERQKKPGAIRLFLDGDAKGVFIDDKFLFQLPRSSRLDMMTGGALKWDGLDKIKQALASLRAACLASWRALIHVTSGGDVAGSDLAGKVKIKRADGTSTTRTVPASQVEAADGRLWIPRWLAIEKAGENLAGEARLPDVLEVAISRLEKELALQVAVMEEAMKPLQEAECIEAPLRAARAERERVEEAARRERERAEEAARRERAEAEAAKRSQRIRELPIHAQGVTLRIRDWVKHKGRFVPEDWDIENATVRVSGQRAYIFEGDAEEPLCKKSVRNISIVQPEPVTTGEQS